MEPIADLVKRDWIIESCRIEVNPVILSVLHLSLACFARHGRNNPNRLVSIVEHDVTGVENGQITLPLCVL